MSKRSADRRKRNRNGSTLPEMLMTLLIISLIACALGGGLVVIRRSYQSITEKAHAEVLLSTTATLLTDSLEYAVSAEAGNGQLQYVNANTSARTTLIWTRAEGVCLRYAGGEQTALVSQAGLTDTLYTSFEDIQCAAEADGRARITIKGLSVHRKTEEQRSDSKEDADNAEGAAGDDAENRNSGAVDDGAPLVKTDLVIRTVNRLRTDTAQ